MKRGRYWPVTHDPKTGLAEMPKERRCESLGCLRDNGHGIDGMRCAHHAKIQAAAVVIADRVRRKRELADEIVAEVVRLADSGDGSLMTLRGLIERYKDASR